MNPRDEQRLRELLDDAVSDVEPRPGLDAIQSRTKVSPMSTRPWFFAAGAAVVATAATIAAFAVLGDDVGTTSTDPGPDPAGSPSQTVSPDSTNDPSPDSEDSGPSATVPVYYVGLTGQGPRLYREFHELEALFPDLAAVRQAVTGEPFDPDYASPWANLGAGVRSVQHDGDTITVDLSGDLRDRPASLNEDEAAMAVEQVIYTAQAAYQERDPVQLLIAGKRTDTVLGVPTSEPLAQGDETSTLAQVWIIDPAEGAEVKSGFEVSGIGAFFEANVVWELRQGDTVVKDGFTTAEECCRMAPYSFTVEAPPGDYTLVVTDSDASGGEGPPPFQDTKNLTIR